MKIERWLAGAVLAVILLLAGGLQAAWASVPHTPILASAPHTPMLASAPHTPLMGWSGYNFAGIHVTEAIVEANAQLMVADGLAAAGYKYVLLDGGWNLPTRSAAGELVADPAKFPDGIAALASYVHSLGLKIGVYLSAGATNCGGHSAGSWGHYSQDAATLAAWHIDAIKFDYCKVPEPLTPATAAALATRMGKAIAATGRAMVLDVNDACGRRNHDQDWKWAAAAGGSEWRVSADIGRGYASMVRQILGIDLPAGQSYDAELWRYAGPGHFNDPDCLETGNVGMDATTNQAEVALWAEEASPLVAGTDLSRISAAALADLANREIIAIDQDPLGVQGHVVSRAGGHYVLTKPLANGSSAVLLFNATTSTATISFTASRVGLPSSASYRVRDVLRHTTNTNTSGHFSRSVPGHGVAMVRITPERGSAQILR
jgi:alpha-galactosidase